MPYFPLNDRLEFYERMEALCRDNIPVYDAFSKLQIAAIKAKKPGHAKRYKTWANKMREVSSIEAALKGWIPDIDLAMLGAAEKTGQLEVGFEKLVITNNAIRQVRAKLMGALVGPSVLLVACLGVMALYTFKVFPEFEKVLDSSRWPTLSSSFYTSGQFIFSQDGAMTLGGIAGTFFVAYLTTGIITGPIRDYLLDYIPPYNLYKMFAAPTFLITFSSLLSSGIPFVEALRFLQTVSGKWMSNHMTRMIDKQRAGLSYAETMETGLLDNEVLGTIIVYGDLSSFEEALEKMAMQALVSVNKKIDGVSKMLNIIALLAIAGQIVWAYLGIFGLVETITGGM